MESNQENTIEVTSVKKKRGRKAKYSSHEEYLKYTNERQKLYILNNPEKIKDNNRRQREKRKLKKEEEKIITNNKDKIQVVKKRELIAKLLDKYSNMTEEEKLQFLN
jgi:hypothetical protein